MKRSSRAGRLTQLERNQRTTGIFFILPSLVLCAIFMVVPLINVIRYSLTDWDGLSKTYNFVGLYNYMHLHEIEGFGEMMLATVTFAIGVTAITIIVSFLAALALDKRGRDRLPRGLMRALWFFPALLSGAVVGILWRIMYNYNNGVRSLLPRACRPSTGWRRAALRILPSSSARPGSRSAFAWWSSWPACSRSRRKCMRPLPSTARPPRSS